MRMRSQNFTDVHYLRRGAEPLSVRPPCSLVPMWVRACGSHGFGAANIDLKTCVSERNPLYL